VLTFVELKERVERFASGLSALGVAPGEGLVTLIGNSWKQLPLYLAATKIGGVLMAPNRYLTDHEIAYKIDVFSPRLMIGSSGYTVEDIPNAA